MRWLVDGVPDAPVPADDRGLRYGDGVFETTLWRGRTCALWRWHMERLARGLARLGIAAPETSLLEAEAVALLGDGDGIVRIVVTRGDGGRGYARPVMATPRRILRVEPLPDAGPSAARALVVRWCELALAEQPALAGLKHLNRLEQVLARAEWDDPAIDEGLLCDAGGNVVSATAGNLFAAIDGAWVTPAIDRCGVAGVCRAALLAGDAPQAIDARAVPRAEIERAEELFLTNAVRGVRPVARLGQRTLAAGPFQHWASARLAMLGFQPLVD